MNPCKQTLKNNMYTEKLEETVLLNPAIELGCTSLKIITGFTDTECIYRHLINLSDLGKNNKFSVDLILGMTSGVGLTKKKHKDINRLISRIQSNQKMPEFICRYKIRGADIHSKVYIWFKGNEPIIAFCGSANYSMNAFFKRRECMTNCDSKEAENYFNTLEKDTILSTDANVKKIIKFSRKTRDTEIENDNLENLSWDMFAGKSPVDTCKISLLQANGKETGYGSGLNWGIRKNGTKRDKDQAYIPYNAKDKKDGFFPLKEKPEVKNNPIFKVVPKDFPPFFMRVAQAGNKGIHTAESNALLGQFFRKKLNIPSGTFITKKMLEDYGKTYVIFKKYENDVYLLDF